MPPSGFNQRAIAGMLQFLEACYDDLRQKIELKGGTPEAVQEAIDEELAELRAHLGAFSLKQD